jgi:hypothetical protein
MNARHTRQVLRSQRCKRARAERQEGAVMLVVMLILLVVTAGAAVSVHTTQSELQAAGQERMALQTQYVAESAIMTTTAYIDQIGNGIEMQQLWAKSNAPAPPPDMTDYGEPSVNPNNRHHAMRIRGSQALAYHEGAGPQVPAVTQPAPPMQGGGAVDQSAALFVDPQGLGSFGPRQAYGLAREATSTIGFVVDVTDCMKAPAVLTPGAQIGGAVAEAQYNCVLTARGRVQLPGASVTRAWTFGAATYNQDMFMSAHDARATLLTPPVPE